MALPAELNTDGEWEDVVERLYACFCSIFFAEPPILAQGRLLTMDGRCLDDGKQEGFWHIVSRDDKGVRLPDFTRARKMPWIPDMIAGSAVGLTRWRYVEGSGKTRQYYWLEQEGYVLILEEQRNTTVLVTAYSVDRKWTTSDLKAKQEKGVAF